MEIRGFTVKYSKRKAKIVKSEEMALLEKVNVLQAKAEKKSHDRNIILELQAEKLRLNVDCLAKRRRIKRPGVKHKIGLINNSRHLSSSTWSNYDHKESWLIT